MAKYVREINGDFYDFLDYIERNKSQLGTSISLEDTNVYSEGDIKVAIYVFERYSYLGENRVTLSVLVTSHENKIKVTAITAGGSQALFFKINRFGEEAFLDKFIHLINRY